MKLSAARGIAATLLLTLACHCLALAEEVDEIEVVGVTPDSASGQKPAKLPFALQRAIAEDLEKQQSLDLSDFLNSSLTSVTINSAQNNPLQPDLQYRGFTASPLLGLPQGLAVYQNGVRVNEPLADTVNWDLLPESAIHSIDLIGGSNPVFGLNTLGGALVVSMKNGFNYSGTELEASAGSWGRNIAGFESGHSVAAGDGSEWAYYLNYSHFDEDGWRDLSDSTSDNVYASLGWRNGTRTALDLNYQWGSGNLTGNGTLPVGLLAEQRSAVFTAPDITSNDMQLLNLTARHELADTIRVSGNAFVRRNITHSFNGDGSEFALCQYPSGDQALFEEADELAEALDESLGIDLDAVCGGDVSDIESTDDLEAFVERQAVLTGLDPDDFDINDVTDDLSGTGVLTDEAINNISRRKQTTRGWNAQLTITHDLLRLDNQLILGFGYLDGESSFNSVLELSRLDPTSRSTRGLGVGTYFDDAATDIRTRSKSTSWFFTDTLDLSERLSLTLSLRYNDIDVTLADRSGQRPELNGDHSFARANPALGLTYAINDETSVYGSYSQSNRVPTPLELSCNEGVFEIARQFAAERGDDPDDVEFECRLPNAFLADPPLLDVVTESVEAGVRGEISSLDYQLSVFSAVNNDDIIFQTTGRSTGLFANVDKTSRRGFESALRHSGEKFDWRASYSYIRAQFDDDFMVLSSNHPDANDDGELQVRSGARLPGLPEQVVKLSADYSIGDRWSAGAEFIYNSDQVLRGDESNSLDTVDGYYLINLRTNLEIGENLSIFARVSNVLDRQYENFGLLGEQPGEILPDLADSRPRYLGAGAPRGGWIGIRYRF